MEKENVETKNKKTGKLNTLYWILAGVLLGVLVRILMTVFL